MPITFICVPYLSTIATAMIEKVLANPDKETAELIKAAQEAYKSEYISCLPDPSAALLSVRK